MSDAYEPQRWYWKVLDTNPSTHRWSSVDKAYVVLADAGYVAWVAEGNVATEVETAAELAGTLNDAYPVGSNDLSVVSNQGETPALSKAATSPNLTVATSGTSLSFPSIGDNISLSAQGGKLFARNVSLLVTNLSDPDQAFRLRVTSYDTSTGDIDGIVTGASGTDTNDQWVLTLLPGPVSTAASTVASLSYIGKATSSTGTTITFTLDSGTIQAGDLLIFADRGDGAPVANAPTDFTIINARGSFILGHLQVLAVKIADGTEAGQTYSGLNSVSSCKFLLCFRADVPILDVEIAGVHSEYSDGNPNAQTIAASGLAGPILKIAVYGAQNAISPRTWSTTADAEFSLSGTSREIWIAYEIDSSSGADTSVDMDDEGAGNILQSCYFTFPTVSALPGDLVVFEDDGLGNAKYPAADATAIAGRVGEFFWHTGKTPPAYAILADGREVSRASYPLLWQWVDTESNNVAADDASRLQGQYGPGDGVSTFTLPDLVTGGEFIRAYTGTGTFGAWQDHQLQSHSHTVSGGQNTVARTQTGANTAGIGGGQSATSGTTGNFGTETRPRNISLLPCICIR